jgi:hypothetical protein
MSTSWSPFGQSVSPPSGEAGQLADVSRFIGPRATPYLRHYEKLRQRGEPGAAAWTDAPPPFALSWHWPAFVMTIPWMFYRKMYAGGIILVALPVFLDHLLPGSLFLGSGLLIAVVAGLCGKSWYLEHAARRLAKARHLYTSDAMRAAYLERASGVSLSAGVFGALIQIVTATVIVLDLLPPSRF